MKKKKWIVGGLSVLFVFTVILVSLGTLYYLDNVRSVFPNRYTVYIYADMTSSQVIDSLCTVGRARSRASLERCVAREGVNGKFRPGKYVFSENLSSTYVIRAMHNGWQSPHNLTLSGTVRTREKLAEKLSSQMMADSVSIDSLLRDDAFLSRYGFDSEHIFAMFLPDTYQVYWTDSPEKILDRFKREYDRFWTEERLEKAAALNLTPMQVSTLASIVSGETLKPFEFPVIAGVYLNRIRRGMKLQADPTVAFCFDYQINRVLKKHLAVDSPYNTYKYAGLPPAPINVPTKTCIDAVLNPREHNFLYFCASPDFDGTHRFASTFKEHQTNARQYQKALNARMKARKNP